MSGHSQKLHFAGILADRALRCPDDRAFSLEGDGRSADISVSYSRLDASARRFAAMLHEHSLSGKRLLLLLHGGEDYVSALFGCWYAGVTVVPVYPPRPGTSSQRVQLIAEDCDAGGVLGTAQILSAMDDAFMPAMKRIPLESIPDDIGDSWAMPAIAQDSLAVLQYTSGSTGNPKGVRLLHRHLIENSRIIAEAMSTSRDSVGVIWIPPFHDMGLIGGLLQPVYAGFPVHLMPPTVFLQRPLRWLEAIGRYGGTISAAPNFAFDLCVRRARPDQIARLDLSTWRVAANGAEPVRADTMRRFADTFAPAGFDARAFFPCFGMAETTLLVTAPRHFTGATSGLFIRHALGAGRLMKLSEDADASANASASASASADTDQVELVSSGRPASGVRVAIVDPASSSMRESGEVGEVWVSGDTVADGYWARPEATRDVFGCRLTGSDLAWLRTGDLGAFADGELYVTGRIKDLIVIRGQNHYPQDVEATALAAHAALRPGGAAAFALDGDDGETVGLVLELERGWRAADLIAIRTAVIEAVSRDHHLHVGTLVLVRPHAVPKTSSGKVQRLAARARLLAGEFERLVDEALA